jgi:hypothetical protein
LNNILDVRTKKIWYYSFVFSILLIYSDSIKTANCNLTDKIQSSQCKIINSLFWRELKIVYKHSILANSIKLSQLMKNNIYSSYKKLGKTRVLVWMSENGFLNFGQIANYRIMLLVIKQKYIIDNNGTNRLNLGLKTSKEHVGATKLIVPYYSTITAQKNFDYRAAVIMNNSKINLDIDFNIEQPSKYKAIKKSIKDFLLHRGIS